MERKTFVGLTEGDVLRVEQIVLDRDVDGALHFIEEVVKKELDRGNNSKMKREGV